MICYISIDMMEDTIDISCDNVVVPVKSTFKRKFPLEGNDVVLFNTICDDAIVCSPVSVAISDIVQSCDVVNKKQHKEVVNEEMTSDMLNLSNEKKDHVQNCKRKRTKRKSN